MSRYFMDNADHYKALQAGEETRETGRVTPSQPTLQNIPIKSEIGKRVQIALMGASASELAAVQDLLSKAPEGQGVEVVGADPSITNEEKYGTPASRPVKGRVCGACVMCCKLVAVQAFPEEIDFPILNKPAGQWCPHTSGFTIENPVKGCQIYKERPKPCRDFECLWLQSEMPDELRPDRIKAVFGGNRDGSIVQVWIDPATPDHWKTNRVLFRTIEHLRQKFTVVILWGELRKLLSMYASKGGGIKVDLINKR